MCRCHSCFIISCTLPFEIWYFMILRSLICPEFDIFGSGFFRSKACILATAPVKASWKYNVCGSRNHLGNLQVCWVCWLNAPRGRNSFSRHTEDAKRSKQDSLEESTGAYVLTTWDERCKASNVNSNFNSRISTSSHMPNVESTAKSKCIQAVHPERCNQDSGFRIKFWFSS